MSNITTTVLSNEYQNWFSKELLKYAVQELRLNEFAEESSLPKNVGGKSVSFFRYGVAASSNVQTLAEGVTPSTTRDLALTKIDVNLVQYGEVCVVTDILSMTELFDALSQGVRSMGEDAALKADDLSRDELVSAGTKRYGQNNADFAALAAGSASSGKYLALDVLDMATRLKINRGKMFGNGYVLVAPPHVTRDVQNDDNWIWADRYAGSQKIFKGELGMLNGTRYVEATNPFIEGAVEGTYDANGSIYSSMMLAKGAFGVTKLAGDSPAKPRVMIVKGASKSDPLDQVWKAGWKAFYAAKSLNEAWYRVYKTKSGFNATLNA